MRKTISKTITYYVCKVLTTSGEEVVITLSGEYEKARREIIESLDTDNFILIEIKEYTRKFDMPVKMFIDMCIKRGDLGGLDKDV